MTTNSVQTQLNNNTIPFIRTGLSLSKDNATIKQDAGRSTDLDFGTVLGKEAVSVPTTGSADAGNTGDGTVTGVAAVPGFIPVVGDWVLECTATATNGGTFKLTDPNGTDRALDLVMTAGAGAATTFIAAGLTFVITDGAADFADGDTFTIAVAAVNKYVPLDPDSAVGADKVAAVYIGADIASADIVAGDVDDRMILVGGGVVVDASQLIVEGSATVDTVLPSGRTVEEELELIGIYPNDTLDIASYENA